MGFFDSTWHLLSTLFIFLFSLLASTRIGRNFGVSDKKGVIIYIWHTAFSMLYCFYTLNSGGDAVYYYHASTEPIFFSGFQVGTGFIVLFTTLFSTLLGFSYLGCFLIFGFFGYIGLVAFCGVLQQATINKSVNIRRLALLSVFLPSISFWSSSIGKDSISFMAAGLMLWAALNFKKRLGYFIFAVIAMLFVRPHIAAIMLGAYSLSFVFDRRVSILPKIFLGVVSIAVCAVMVPFAMKYAGIGDAQNTSDVEAYINKRQDSNLGGGSSLDISSMSFPMKLFTYLCRPLPFEAHSIFALVSSLENVLLLLIFIFTVYAIAKNYKPSITSNRIFLWLYLVMTWIILAETTANLGIAVRQKTMFVPVLIFLGLSILGTPSASREKK